jgi:hypothetical protein
MRKPAVVFLVTVLCAAMTSYALSQVPRPAPRPTPANLKKLGLIFVKATPEHARIVEGRPVQKINVSVSGASAVKMVKPKSVPLASAKVTVKFFYRATQNKPFAHIKTLNLTTDGNGKCVAPCSGLGKGVGWYKVNVKAEKRGFKPGSATAEYVNTLG